MNLIRINFYRWRSNRDSCTLWLVSLARENSSNQPDTHFWVWTSVCSQVRKMSIAVFRRMKLVNFETSLRQLAWTSLREKTEKMRTKEQKSCSKTYLNNSYFMFGTHTIKHRRLLRKQQSEWWLSHLVRQCNERKVDVLQAFTSFCAFWAL